MKKGRGMCVVALTLACRCCAAAASATASGPPSGSFVPGVVEPPPLGLALHCDAVWHSSAEAFASATAKKPDKQVVQTPDGPRVTVKTSPRYTASLEYDEGLVGFLDSLVHGHELDGLKVFVATPGEMADACGGAAAACFIPQQGRIYIVGQSSFGGFPTSLRARPRVWALDRGASAQSALPGWRPALGHEALGQRRGRLPGVPERQVRTRRRGSLLLRQPRRGLRRVIRLVPLRAPDHGMALDPLPASERSRLRRDPRRRPPSLDPVPSHRAGTPDPRQAPRQQPPPGSPRATACCG